MYEPGKCLCDGILTLNQICTYDYPHCVLKKDPPVLHSELCVGDMPINMLQIHNDSRFANKTKLNKFKNSWWNKIMMVQTGFVIPRTNTRGYGLKGWRSQILWSLTPRCPCWNWPGVPKGWKYSRLPFCRYWAFFHQERVWFFLQKVFLSATQQHKSVCCSLNQGPKHCSGNV